MFWVGQVIACTAVPAQAAPGPAGQNAQSRPTLTATMPLRRSTRHLLHLFVTGLLAALPLAATVAIVW